MSAAGIPTSPLPTCLIALAALDLLSESARRAPVVVIVDDAHWLDRPTATRSAFVGRQVESDAIFFLGAARRLQAPPLGGAAERLGDLMTSLPGTC
jgi:hypothetical protein